MGATAVAISAQTADCAALYGSSHISSRADNSASANFRFRSSCFPPCYSFDRYYASTAFSCTGHPRCHHISPEYARGWPFLCPPNVCLEKHGSSPNVLSPRNNALVRRPRWYYLLLEYRSDSACGFCYPYRSGKPRRSCSDPFDAVRDYADDWCHSSARPSRGNFVSRLNRSHENRSERPTTRVEPFKI